MRFGTIFLLFILFGWNLLVKEFLKKHFVTSGGSCKEKISKTMFRSYTRSFFGVGRKETASGSSEKIRERVIKARELQSKQYEYIENMYCNA